MFSATIRINLTLDFEYEFRNISQAELPIGLLIGKMTQQKPRGYQLGVYYLSLFTNYFETMWPT